MAWVEPKGHPADTKTGDVIHVFRGGSIQMLPDVSIDPAGNVWAANNWNAKCKVTDVSANDTARRRSAQRAP